MRKGPNRAIHHKDGSVEIILTHRDDTYAGSCFVDAADYPAVKDYRWFIAPTNGPCVMSHAPDRKSQDIAVTMHRFLLNAPREMRVDHIDGDRLNNRRLNLRLITQSQKSSRSRSAKHGRISRFRGVHLNRNCYVKKWTALITFNKQPISLGYYATEEEAARAYDEAARKYFGPFARPNFPA